MDPLKTGNSAGMVLRFPFFLLSDLPKLTSFKCGDNCFRRRHTLSLKRARFSFFVELQRSNRSSISPADSRAFHSAISIWWRVFCYFPLNELQICRSWSRFGSAVPRFGVQLDSISPIWRIFAASRLELARSLKSQRCILWVEADEKWHVDLPNLETIEFQQNSAYKVKTMVFTGGEEGRRRYL